MFFFWGGGGGGQTSDLFFFWGGGYADFWDIFWASSQKWTGFRGHSYAFYSLFLTIYRMLIFFGVAKISNIFLDMPDIPDFFFENSRFWIQAYV